MPCFFRYMAVVMLLLALSTTVHLAIQAIHRAVGVLVSVAFKLNSRVTNAILLTQHGFERSQDRCALAGWEIADRGVTGEGIHAAGDAPHMQVMHILHL